MRTSTCLKSGGTPVPFRVSASSLKGKSSFKLAGNSASDQISYKVTWGGADATYQLNNSADLTDVQQADTKSNCDYRTLSVEMDNQNFESASEDTYTDTLSLIFVIE